MVEGKYMIFDSEKKEWLEVPDNWKSGDPLHNQSIESNPNTKSGNGDNNEENVIDERRIGENNVDDAEKKKNNIPPGELPNNVSMT